MNYNYIDIFHDTLIAFEKGYYETNGEMRTLKLSSEERKAVTVFFPDDIKALKAVKDFVHMRCRGSRCRFDCVNADSFEVAYRDSQLTRADKDEKEVLVLNMANPVNPGGGVRSGSRAQEEDLCRKSSLFMSLISEGASEYYKYNKTLDSFLGSDAIIITPKVEIIKDIDYNYLNETRIVSVMTCAAPCINYGKEGLSREQYEDMLYNRICGMLRCAAYMGYRRLVLGAFGCGAFGNDAKVVSDLFFRAFKEFDFDGMKTDDMFDSVSFAVLSKDSMQYNFKEFYRNFGGENYYG